MARAKKGIQNLNETLSTENSEIQEELLKDLVDNQEIQVNPGSNENNELNNLSNENTEENKEELVNPGDRVKIKGNTTTDCMGRRIHNGLRNYVYTVRTVRPDKIACVECLTHVFNIKLSDLEKIK